MASWFQKDEFVQGTEIRSVMLDFGLLNYVSPPFTASTQALKCHPKLNVCDESSGGLSGRLVPVFDGLLCFPELTGLNLS